MIPEKHIDEAISKLFTDLTFTTEPAGLYDPLRYMMEIGGKRIRPRLCLTAYALYKDGVPVIGNMEKLLDIEFFYLPDNITIQPGSKSRFTLLWLWESESDEKDVDIASSVKSYTLIVNVTAGMSD